MPEESALSHPFNWWALIASVIAWLFAYLWGSDVAGGDPPHLFIILLAATSSTWVYLDSKRRGIGMVGAVHFLLYFCWVVAVPIYLIYTRGKTGLLWAVLQASVVCGAWYAGWELNNYSPQNSN